MDADFEDYRDEMEMNNSEALRELVRTGLADYKSDDEPESSKWDDVLLSTASNLATITVVVAVLGAFAVFPTQAAVALGAVSIALSCLLVAEVKLRIVRSPRETTTPGAEVSE